MSTSTAEGRVLNGALADYSEADEPVDSGFANVTINNLLHYADQAGQVRAAWFGTNDNGLTLLRGARVSQAVDPLIFSDGSPSIDTMYPIWRAGFPATIREDGSSYQLRVRLAADTTNGTAVTFRMAAAPIGFAEEYVNNVSGYPDSVMSATTSTTTIAYLGNDLLVLDAFQAAEAVIEQPTIDAVGGNAVSVRWAWIDLEVWASIPSANEVPNLVGVYAAEFVGT